MRRVLLAVLAGAVTAALLLEAVASASPGTLDQQQPNIGSFGYFVRSGQSQAQTFTAGISGGLDQADLYLEPEGSPSQDMTVEIRDGSAAGAGTQVLASGNVPSSSVGSGSFVPVGFNPPAPVVTGQQYAIVAYSSAPSPNNYTWRVAGTDPYPPGAAFAVASTPPSGSWTPLIGDYAFKTYVVPTPAPTTGQRAAALQKCKKKAKKKDWTKKQLKKCKKKAKKLPV